MKRHESIVAFSRQHHFDLLFSWKIKQGLNRQIAAERIVAYLKYFWVHHLQIHFQEEETYLYNSQKDELCEQAVTQHRQITQLIETTLNTPSDLYEKLQKIADKVDAHIRFEERELFPHLEKILSATQLNEINAQLLLQNKPQPNDDFADQFWMAANT